MEEIIRLSKKIEKAKDERMYVQNLETVVKDLSSTSFNRGLQLYGEGGYYASCHNIINYGTNIRKDKSGVPKEVNVERLNVSIKTLRQLRRHIRKAKRTENPYFKIKYIPPGHGHPFIYKVEGIRLNEEDSSTSVTARLDDFYDRAEVQFKYDTKSSERETRRIERSVSRLLKRGYEKVFIET